MYLAKTPRIVKPLYRDLIWNLPGKEKVLYLTFDDGPIPEVTPWVLDQLREFNAQATFFCVGENVKKYPGIYQRLRDEGHATGNHTFNHLNGWKTADQDYLSNVDACSEWVNSPLFRPPYGKVKRSQIAQLKQDFHLIMWDVLSADFDTKISGEKCLSNVLNNANPGSIIVFHDNTKALDRLQYALPRVLKHYSEAGFRFDGLDAILSKENLRKKLQP